MVSILAKALFMLTPVELGKAIKDTFGTKLLVGKAVTPCIMIMSREGDQGC